MCPCAAGAIVIDGLGARKVALPETVPRRLPTLKGALLMAPRDLFLQDVDEVVVADVDLAATDGLVFTPFGQHTINHSCYPVNCR